MAVSRTLEAQFKAWRETFDDRQGGRPGIKYEEQDWEITLRKDGAPVVLGRVEREHHRTFGGYRCWQAFYAGHHSPVTDSLFGVATKDVAALVVIRAYWLHTLGWKHERICRAIQHAVKAHEQDAPLDEVEPWLWFAR